MLRLTQNYIGGKTNKQTKKNQFPLWVNWKTDISQVRTLELLEKIYIFATRAPPAGYLMEVQHDLKMQL